MLIFGTIIMGHGTNSHGLMEMIEDNNLRILAKRPRKLNAFAI